MEVHLSNACKLIGQEVLTGDWPILADINMVGGFFIAGKLKVDFCRSPGINVKLLNGKEQAIRYC